MAMSDQQLSDLFAEGTAPESDPGFTGRVEAEIGRVRLRSRLLAVALPACGVLMLSGVLYEAAAVIRPVLAPLVGEAPQFMGVPFPIVLGALAAGLALSARRYVLSR
jgi:hypothetical protein